MSITLDEPGVFVEYAPVSMAHIEALARTYEFAAAPVWVETPNGECIYRNRRAGREGFAPAASATFEVVDFDGQIVAYLRTLAHA